MGYRVHELSRAQADVRSIVDWLKSRSPQGAAAWLDAYDAMLEGLSRFATHAVAPENAEAEFEVRQVLFKTRRGKVYRDLYLVDGDDVYILRVRGKGQAPVDPPDLGGPP
jgi:plasmid stabilization system protein ParE